MVYWDPVAVTPGATYFLEFVLHDYALLGLNYSEDERNYAKGTAWAGNPNDLSEPYQVVENFDFTFVTVVRASPAESTVPEPATMTLLATGLAALGATRRKRRTL